MTDVTPEHNCEFLSTCCGNERHEYVDEFCGACNEWASFECNECIEAK